MEEKSNNIAIVVSGGPAPGINAVISAAALEAINLGFRPYGSQHGFIGLMNGELRELEEEEVARIYNIGGSILGTSRFNPLHLEEDKKKLEQSLKQHNIERLVIIGGEGSATVSYHLSKAFPQLHIAHVPKTIDNDLPLPNDQVTFGFETARSIGAQVVDTLITDAKTCERWYLVETMGRQAGFLTLGIALAAGATIALIPEEFSDRMYSIDEVAERIAQCMQRRIERGKNYGVIMLAEGILDCVDPKSSEELQACPKDALGRITYSEIELGELLIPIIEKMVKEKVTIKHKHLGYELRAARPIAPDVEYGRLLGFGAVHCLRGKPGAYMVTREKNSLRFPPLDQFVVDNRIPGRTLNLDSHLYRMAQHFLAP